MNNKQPTYHCYVFSQATLNRAITDWVKFQCEDDPKNKEIFLITETALPWLLNDFCTPSSIYSFSFDDLQTGIEQWKTSQIEAYPQQKKRINDTCDYLLEFFQSSVIKQYKMIIDA